MCLYKREQGVYETSSNFIKDISEKLVWFLRLHPGFPVVLSKHLETLHFPHSFTYFQPWSRVQVFG